MKRFEGKVAHVTGAGTGIGRGIALRLAAEGAQVVVSGRREAPLSETVSLVTEAGGSADFVTGNVAVPTDVERIVAGTVARFGRIDVLVNNAGIIRRQLPAGETTPEEWDELLDVNLKGVYLVSRAALPHLTAASGNIVNIASCLALVSVPGTAAYQASKAGVLGLSRSMAHDYAPEVRVNVVSPGLVLTPISYVDRPDFDEMLPQFEEQHPMKRAGTPDDVAGAVAYLAADEAGWVTGAQIVVDGGFTLT